MKDSIQSNRPLITFFGKVLAVYGLWYVVYDLWLLPAGWFDRWLSLQVAEMGGETLALIGFDTFIQGRSTGLAGSPGVRVVNGCNGLSTIGLFLGFVVAFPGRWTRRLLFLPAGIAVIYLSNVFRVALLAATQKVWPAAFEFVHGLGAPAFFYLIVFGLWVAWANVGGADFLDDESDEPEAKSAHQVNASSGDDRSAAVRGEQVLSTGATDG
jgi:exosortase family protein XrtF